MNCCMVATSIKGCRRTSRTCGRSASELLQRSVEDWHTCTSTGQRYSTVTSRAKTSFSAATAQRKSLTLVWRAWLPTTTFTRWQPRKSQARWATPTPFTPGRASCQSQANAIRLGRSSLNFSWGALLPSWPRMATAASSLVTSSGPRRTAQKAACSADSTRVHSGRSLQLQVCRPWRCSASTRTRTAAPHFWRQLTCFETWLRLLRHKRMSSSWIQGSAGGRPLLPMRLSSSQRRCS
mmetsp:Transcript_43874/g.102502  ORF Transcript_43874/g.102502 Transcript_43874/m.102502 type:complete len:237 (-) Transcript_43874:465-1175(-)